MTRYFARLVFLVTIGLSTGPAKADLLISFSDAGSGQTRFQLSGSDSVVSGNYVDNEIWFHHSDWDNYPSGGTGYYALTSGSFSIETTKDGVRSGLRVYNNGIFGFGLDVGGEDTLNLSDGDSLSWSGIFTIAADFSSWSAARYDSPTLDIFGDGSEIATFANNVVVSASAVPEPSSLMMLGIGLAAFARIRRRNPAAA